MGLVSPYKMNSGQQLWRLQQSFFLVFFRLAEFFSGGFSANAENIQLGG